MNLFKRYMISVTAAFVFLVGFFSWQSYEINQTQIMESNKHRVDLLAEIIQNGLKTIMLEGKPKREFQKFLEGLVAEDIESVRIYSEHGIVLASTVPGEIGRNITAQHSGKSGGGNPNFQIHSAGDHEVYSRIVVMKNDWPCHRCHGSWDKIQAILAVDLSSKRGDRTSGSSRLRTIGLYLFTVAVLVLSAGLIFSRKVKRPVEHILDSLKRIKQGDFKADISTGENDEIGEIAAGIAGLGAELERLNRKIDLFQSRESSHIEKMASIGEVAATVAHEIKNPLAGISGALQVMAEDIPDDNPRKSICNEILGEIGRLDQAVKDLIVYAKPQEPNLILVHISEVVDKAVRAVKETAESRNVKIEVVLQDTPQIFVDSDQMEQALKNIMLAQFNLMPDGGGININTFFKEETKEIEIILSDNGKGISDDKLQNIFKPLFSSKHSGTGLSLAISRNIVESHKGRISVESEPGVGSTFHIIIPLKS